MLGFNMFAYCNNTPIVCSDSSGNLPIRNTMLQANDGGGARSTAGNIPVKKTSAFKNTDEQVVHATKIKRSIQVAARNVIATAGIGLGMYGGIIATEYATLDAGMHYDLLRIELSKGTLDVYQYYYEGIEASLLFIIGGDSHEMRRDASGIGNWATKESLDVIPIFGAGCYLFAGGSISIGFDFNSAAREWADVWRK